VVVVGFDFGIHQHTSLTRGEGCGGCSHEKAWPPCIDNEGSHDKLLHTKKKTNGMLEDE
jgi:hypothetical protein